MCPADRRRRRRRPNKELPALIECVIPRYKGRAVEPGTGVTIEVKLKVRVSQEPVHEVQIVGRDSPGVGERPGPLHQVWPRRKDRQRRRRNRLWPLSPGWYCSGTRRGRCGWNRTHQSHPAGRAQNSRPQRLAKNDLIAIGDNVALRERRRQLVVRNRVQCAIGIEIRVREAQTPIAGEEPPKKKMMLLKPLKPLVSIARVPWVRSMFSP